MTQLVKLEKRFENALKKLELVLANKNVGEISDIDEKDRRRTGRCARNNAVYAGDTKPNSGGQGRANVFSYSNRRQARNADT